MLTLSDIGVADFIGQRHGWRGVKRRYVDSARHTLEVDYREYATQMREDMESGKAGY